MSNGSKYKCPECGWIGQTCEMDADALCNTDIWSNHICPSCRMWWSLDDYDVVSKTERMKQ
jgi:predicted RNA-binding Zn-ribbon protein involved in translation (DUF1610 family)